MEHFIDGFDDLEFFAARLIRLEETGEVMDLDALLGRDGHSSRVRDHLQLV